MRKTCSFVFNTHLGILTDGEILFQLFQLHYLMLYLLNICLVNYLVLVDNSFWRWVGVSKNIERTINNIYVRMWMRGGSEIIIYFLDLFFEDNNIIQKESN